MRRVLQLGWPLLALVAACGGSDPDPPGALRDCSATVFYQPLAPPAELAVVGEFNGWDPAGAELSDPDGDGLWRAVLSPPPGSWRYRLRLDGVELLDPYNPLTLMDPERGECSALVIADCDRPVWAVRRFEARADGTLEVELEFLRARSGRALDAATLEARLADDTPLAVEAVEPSGIVRLDGADLARTRHRLVVTAADRAGVEAEELAVPFWVEAEAFDWADAVIYQVMVDRFRRGAGELDPSGGPAARHGGDLDGVRAALEDGTFARLGVRALWLSPLYDNPEEFFSGRDGQAAQGYHGYWPAAARAVESAFGGQAALRELVAAAHARGIRVLVDAVLNHVHQSHPYYLERARAGWFNRPDGDCICGSAACPWSGFIEECWFDPFLPDLRWDNPAVVAQLVDDALWWLQEFELDGLRLDAVPMMPRLATRHLRAAVERRLGAGGLHTYLLGETYTGRGGQADIRQALGPAGLSGQFDYPVLWALRDALSGRGTMLDLAAEAERSRRAWEGSGAVMAPVLGSHDVPRFLSDVNGDALYSPWLDPPPTPEADKPYRLLAVAWAFLLSQPGAPVITQGDEIGLAGGADPDNRRDMRFAPDLSEREAWLLARVEALSAARAGSRALRRGERRDLVLHETLWAYAQDAGDGYPAVVVLNPASVERTLTLALPEDIDLEDGAVWAELSGLALEVGAGGRALSLTVPARSAALLFAGGI